MLRRDFELSKRAEPWLGACNPSPRFAAPVQSHLCGVQSVMRENEPAPLLICEPVIHKIEIKSVVQPIEFIPNNRMTDMREVNANLMLAAGTRLDFEQREIALRMCKVFLHAKFCLRRRSEEHTS